MGAGELEDMKAGWIRAYNTPLEAQVLGLGWPGDPWDGLEALPTKYKL